MKKIISTFTSLFVVGLFAVSTTFASVNIPALPGPINKTDTSGNTATIDAVTLQKSLHEFNSLSKQERKSRIKEAKSYLKEYKAQKASGDEVSTNQLLLVILAILLPPLAVYLHENAINSKFWLSLLLTLLFWLPGLIYALIVILG
jgi:uncharacterized membrane protein YqaE (UPF0057 family)